MTPQLLRRIGEALYGEVWQSSLAHSLGVAPRTVRRWVSGEDIPKPGVWAELRQLVEDRGERLAQLMAELDRL